MRLIIMQLLAILLFSSCNTKEKGNNQEERIRLLVIAGGHSFDTAEFVDMFRSFEDIEFDTMMQPGANRFIAQGGGGKYDAIVFYDMWQEADSITRMAYLDLTRERTGLVFLHHSLVSYQQWDEFEDMVGGRYIEDWSTDDSTLWSGYRHDIHLEIQVLNSSHPATRGIDDFSILDEGYSNIRVSPDVDSLLLTDHPECNSLVGWTHKYQESKVVYLLGGHDKHASENENFRKVLKQAIAYVSEKELSH